MSRFFVTPSFFSLHTPSSNVTHTHTHHEIGRQDTPLFSLLLESSFDCVWFGFFFFFRSLSSSYLWCCRTNKSDVSNVKMAAISLLFEKGHTSGTWRRLVLGEWPLLLHLFLSFQLKWCHSMSLLILFVVVIVANKVKYRTVGGLGCH